MDIVNILRFYGSCGHIEDEVISEEKMIEMSAERIVKTIFGDFPSKAEVTTEGNKMIVHIYPDRWCCCGSCFNEIGKEL